MKKIFKGILYIEKEKQSHMKSMGKNMFNEKCT